MKILLIEDEPKVAAFIKQGLEEHQHTVEVAYDGLTGERAALQNDYDLAIIDVMLPYKNGLELCTTIRSRTSHLLILMLTALNTTQDIVDGLQAGADDYLAKPFHFSELLARIQALGRRQQQFVSNAINPVLTYADLTLNTYTKTASREGKEIRLTAREYSLLELFMRNSNKVLSRIQIAEAVWGFDFDTGTNTIDVYINYLRNKIDKGFNGGQLIHTVIGMGYMMKLK
ncbi:DNA-binding response OmpR family regulator [Chitinophaga skermanii]|uniref:DNA-binding response OmpR family regulator n=1 Tax=Chitinophaga skermanii TaxID=331697 RepID=A0A327Q5A5_9BACT|nr:response regulator transcription factor [Chitinophaga skermanii]RAI99715.1 DNA-binding response OmpR family regulator [Chitinophaga skermanii]